MKFVDIGGVMVNKDNIIAVYPNTTQGKQGSLIKMIDGTTINDYDKNPIVLAQCLNQ